MFNIVYCSNDNYFEGLYLSILSILNRSKSTFNFTILTADLSMIDKSYTSITPYHIELLEKMIKSFNQNNILRVIDCQKEYLETFGKQDIDRYSPYTMLKLFIPNYYENGLVLFLDVDTMANQDITQAFDIDMDGVEMCVCRDYYRHILQKNPNSKFFSGGVWLININQVKNNNLFNKAINYFNAYHPFGNEEASLNETVTNIKYWPDEYRFNFQMPGIEDKTVIKHFVFSGQKNTIKQWDINEVRQELGLHNWDKDYEYFLNQKKTWKVNPTEYKIIYSCSKEYFDDLYLSISTLLDKTKVKINFYILTGDFTYISNEYEPINSSQISKLEVLIKSYNSNNTLKILDCTDYYKQNQKISYLIKNIVPFRSLKAFVHYFKEIEGIALYLDADTLINGDIANLWNNIDISSSQICATHDYYLKKLINKDIFNLGVMLMNLDQIRRSKLFEKSIEHYFKMLPSEGVDVSIYNFLSRFKTWNNEYWYNCQTLDINDNTIIKHFNGMSLNKNDMYKMKNMNMSDILKKLNIHIWDKYLD